MSFRKPFRAVPIKLGPDALARRRQARRKDARAAAAWTLGTAVLGGLAAGLALGLPTEGVRGFSRSNTPPARAYYAGCNAARAAGVAPLYAGEPGYRPEMDGDGDGIACEPPRNF